MHVVRPVYLLWHVISKCTGLPHTTPLNNTESHNTVSTTFFFLLLIWSRGKALDLATPLQRTQGESPAFLKPTILHNR